MNNNEFFTAKMDRMFYTIMIDEENHLLMESLLETILGGKVEILEYPRTQLKVKSGIDKAKVSDCVIKLNEEIIHLEVETGIGEISKVKNMTNFCNIYSQNAIMGE